MRKRLQDLGVGGIDVASSGTWGLTGDPATRFAADVMAARGVDVASHRARHLDPEEVRAADLVVAMTSVHLRELEEACPGCSAKTLLLKEVLEIEPQALDDGASSEQRLEALLAAARPARRRAHDVDDPMGLPRAVYERCADEIEAGVTRLVDLLFSRAA